MKYGPQSNLSLSRPGLKSEVLRRPIVPVGCTPLTSVRSIKALRAEVRPVQYQVLAGLF